jgi:phosphonate transport system substrate-binding protein
MVQQNRPSPLTSLSRRLLVAVAACFAAACAAPEVAAVDLRANLLSGELHVPDAAPAAVWRIGYDRRLEPREDVRQALSLAAWLGERTGLEFGVVPARTELDSAGQICAGEIDFAVVGTVAYLQAAERCGASILVRGLNAAGEDSYRAAIVVRPASSLVELGELAGFTFAFGARLSTQGHLIPRLMLEEAGIGLADLGGFAHHESHQATADAISSGRFDAGAVQDTLAYTLAERGLVRIVALSERYPSSGIVAGPEVPGDLAALVRGALVEFDPAGRDAVALHRWERSEMPRGFVPATDDEYGELRDLAARLELIGR